ncbi:zinc ribbon domain-containing protein [Flaviramulus aquimarinus]|uniref:Zinc ribbon domain-containing protein n=1 Tax=Flaviramulus aquimarinus TaxID=1170456 RepID=A0ABP9EPP3_9FLAO
MKNKRTSKFCQSCGMPMKKDPQQGGFNKNGTKSADYCSYCYVDGEFTFKGTTKEMQAFCKQKMIEQGSPKFLAWLFTRSIPRLSRWRMKPR